MPFHARIEPNGIEPVPCFSRKSSPTSSSQLSAFLMDAMGTRRMKALFSVTLCSPPYALRTVAAGELGGVGIGAVLAFNDFRLRQSMMPIRLCRLWRGGLV